MPIIYEDDRIVVIDKPAGLLTTSTRLPGRAARAAQATAENLLGDYLRKRDQKGQVMVGFGWWGCAKLGYNPTLPLHFLKRAV